MISSETRGGLVLTRRLKPGEDTVIIGEDILVQVIAVKGNAVRLRFITPANTHVVREEIRHGQQQRKR